MPFKDQKVPESVYTDGIKKAFEELNDEWEVLRADDEKEIPEGLCSICFTIQEAGLIIGDLTSKNPNVFLELGLSLGLEKRYILLCQAYEDLPFDMRSYRRIKYSPEEIKDLKEKIKASVGIIGITEYESPFSVLFIPLSGTSPPNRSIFTPSIKNEGKISIPISVSIAFQEEDRVIGFDKGVFQKVKLYSPDPAAYTLKKDIRLHPGAAETLGGGFSISPGISAQPITITIRITSENRQPDMRKGTIKGENSHLTVEWSKTE